MTIKVPVKEYIKLQKAYIKLLEKNSSLDIRNIHKENEELKHLVSTLITDKLSSESKHTLKQEAFMGMADVLKEALEEGDYETIAQVEKVLRKAGFGPSPF